MDTDNAGKTTAQPQAQPPRVDYSDPEFSQNPYPTYTRLRAQEPVHRLTTGPDGPRIWLVTRHEDVEQVLRDPRIAKDLRNALSADQFAALPPIPGVMKLLFWDHLLAKDPPDHTRLRKLVSKSFTPRFIEGRRERIQAITDGLLDAVEDRARQTGRRDMDFIEDFAFPLPITVIAEMLGVPAADRDRFRAWTDTVVSFEPGEEYAERRVPRLEEFTRYLRDLFAEKRANPGDDLASGLVRAEEEGDALSEDEMLAMVFLLIVAGHETTVNLIGNGTLALLTHEDQLAKLKADPDLIGPAVEELLRYDGPVETSTHRYAAEDVEIGGTTIPKGDGVLVVLSSANRDPAYFEDPDRLDIARERNHHLAFGKGIHYCLGAPLARLEGQIAFGTLFRRMPELGLAVRPEELSWRPGSIIRGLRGLPLTF